MFPKFKTFSDNFEYALNIIIIEEKLTPEDIVNDDDLEGLATLLQVVLEPLNYSKELTIPNLRKSITESFSKRHFNYDVVNDEYDLVEYRMNFEQLSSIEAADQRTLEWYQFRWSRITASDIARVCGFSGEIARLDVMFNKASKLEDYIEKRVKNNFGGDAINHGKKMEEVSVMLYQERNNVIVEEFGCLPHPIIPHLAASPDGIVSPKSPNLNYHGRMLEIKNPYSRPITGIPKTEYYAQVQVQLEVCNLDYCDFLETWIMEYSNSKEFYEDSPEDDPQNIRFRANGMEKGIIFTYCDAEQDNQEVHIYCPRNIRTDEELKLWRRSCMDKYKESEYNLLVGFKYWKLMQYNVATIKRSFKYFESIKPKLKSFWDDVLKYREMGAHHIEELKNVVRASQRNDYFDKCCVEIDEQEMSFLEKERLSLEFLSDDEDDDDEEDKKEEKKNLHHYQSSQKIKTPRNRKNEQICDFLSDSEDED